MYEFMMTERSKLMINTFGKLCIVQYIPFIMKQLSTSQHCCNRRN